MVEDIAISRAFTTYNGIHFSYTRRLVCVFCPVLVRLIGIHLYYFYYSISKEK